MPQFYSIKKGKNAEQQNGYTEQGLTFKEIIFQAQQIFYWSQITLNGVICVVFVFRTRHMQSRRWSDRALGNISQGKSQNTTKRNNGRIMYSTVSELERTFYWSLFIARIFPFPFRALKNTIQLAKNLSGFCVKPSDEVCVLNDKTSNEVQTFDLCLIFGLLVEISITSRKEIKKIQEMN